jgi:hypothetical protein
MAPFGTLAEAAREYRLDLGTVLKELRQIEENSPRQPRNKHGGNGKMDSQSRKGEARP